MRYIGTIDLFIYTDDRLDQDRSDREAMRKAEDLASLLRSTEDNQAKVVSVCQNSWGKTDNREVEK